MIKANENCFNKLTDRNSFFKHWNYFLYYRGLSLDRYVMRPKILMALWWILWYFVTFVYGLTQESVGIRNIILPTSCPSHKSSISSNNSSRSSSSTSSRSGRSSTSSSGSGSSRYGRRSYSSSRYNPISGSSIISSNSRSSSSSSSTNTSSSTSSGNIISLTRSCFRRLFLLIILLARIILS